MADDVAKTNPIPIAEDGSHPATKPKKKKKNKPQKKPSISSSEEVKDHNKDVHHQAKPLIGVSVQSRSGTVRTDFGTNDTTTMLEPIPTKVVSEHLDTVLQAKHFFLLYLYCNFKMIIHFPTGRSTTGHDMRLSALHRQNHAHAPRLSVLSETLLLQTWPAGGSRMCGRHSAGGARRIPASGSDQDAAGRGRRPESAEAYDATTAGNESGTEGEAQGGNQRLR